MVTPAEVKAIKAEVRRRITDLSADLKIDGQYGYTEDQVMDAQDLAVDLYRAAEHHGIDIGMANALTSFISAAIDGVRARDRAHSREAS